MKKSWMKGFKLVKQRILEPFSGIKDQRRKNRKDLSPQRRRAMKDMKAGE